MGTSLFPFESLSRHTFARETYSEVRTRSLWESNPQLCHRKSPYSTDWASLCGSFIRPWKVNDFKKIYIFSFTLLSMGIESYCILQCKTVAINWASSSVWKLQTTTFWPFYILQVPKINSSKCILAIRGQQPADQDSNQQPLVVM